MSTLSQTDNFDPFACGGRNDEITTVTALNSAGEPVQIRLGMGAQPEVLAAADPPNRSEAMLLEEITSAPSIEHETVSHAGAAPAERGPSVRITDPHLKAAADLFATWLRAETGRRPDDVSDEEHHKAAATFIVRVHRLIDVRPYEKERVPEPVPADLSGDEPTPEETAALRSHCEAIAAEYSGPLPLGDAGLIEAERRIGELISRTSAVYDEFSIANELKVEADVIAPILHAAESDLREFVHDTPPATLAGAYVKLRDFLRDEMKPLDLRGASLAQVLEFREGELRWPVPEPDTIACQY